MGDVVLFDPMDDKSLVQAHIAAVPHTCFSDSDLFVAIMGFEGVINIT